MAFEVVKSQLKGNFSFAVPKQFPFILDEDTIKIQVPLVTWRFDVPHEIDSRQLEVVMTAWLDPLGSPCCAHKMILVMTFRLKPVRMRMTLPA